MLIEEYFDFFSPDDIRLKSSRIGIESVLYEYIYREQSPEAIATRFPPSRLSKSTRPSSTICITATRLATISRVGLIGAAACAKSKTVTLPKS
jgi:hypothetical protein